jgi:RNA recognition motif-containing protein
MIILQARQEELSLKEKTVFIQNLPPHCTEQELINALQLCGDVSDAPTIALLLCSQSVSFYEC